MKIIPWVCFLAAAVAAVFLYNDNQQAKTQLAKVSAQVEEVAVLREQVAQLKELEPKVAEIERLEKEAAEVHKLRNEVRQLKTEKQTLNQELQKQRMTVESVAPQQVALQELQQQNQTLRNENEQFQRARVQREVNACINNLRQLDGGKEQWALENKKAAGAVPTWEDIVGETRYVRNMPVCPGGGQYSLNSVGENPVCTVPGHQLPQ